MAFLKKTEKTDTSLTDTIQNGQKLQLEEDIDVVITSYKEGGQYDPHRTQQRKPQRTDANGEPAQENHQR